MKKLNNERGSVLVFITLMIVLLMIMAGMGMDTGILTFTRSAGQGAVDSAALSAVSALPLRSDDQVKARAIFANAQNNYTGSGTNAIDKTDVSYVNYDFVNNIVSYGATVATANGVRVALEGGSAMKTPAFLTPIMNLFSQKASGSNNVSVSAVAVAITVPSIPIVIWDNVCGANQEQKDNQELKFQNPNEKKATTAENACWTTYLDCSSGASDIKALFTTASECTGRTTGVEIGTPICQNKGAVTSALHEADQFFTKDYPGRWWLVPVIKGGHNCAPTDPTKITNWAKIYPTAVDSKGNPKTIKAHVVCDPTLPQQIQDNTLCFAHKLVREPAKGM